jgi:hypothetical protein
MNELNLVSRLIYLSKITVSKKKLELFYIEDCKGKHEIEHAVDCLAFSSVLKSNIRLSSGTERIDNRIELQALYNLKSKEILFATSILLDLPTEEYHIYFSNDYLEIREDLKNKGFSKAMKEIYIPCGELFNLEEKKRDIWNYVRIGLALEAMDDLYKKDLDTMMKNIRGIQ